MRFTLRLLTMAALTLGLVGGQYQPVAQSLQSAISTEIYRIKATDIDGQTVNLSDFKGKTLLIVNTASYCGYTPQYTGLETIFERYKSRGLVVLAFPSNDFFNQEPGSNQDIKDFCTANYQTTFPIFSKVAVTGPLAHPLFQWLTSRPAGPVKAGPVTWNFNKFLVSRDGRLVARFDTELEPTAPEIIKQIEKTL